MDAKTFLEEARRLCKAQHDCEDCPAYDGEICHLCYVPTGANNLVQMIETVKKWSEEHPKKTRLEDLKRKHSHIPMINGYPPFAPRLVGYCGNIQTCAGCKQKHDSMHKQCWDMEAKE